MNVALAGGSGFIGRHLCERLAARGDRVTVLTRGPLPTGGQPVGAVTKACWDPVSGEGLEALLEQADAVVNFCGESIAGGRWSPERKRLILDSRLGPTKTLVAALSRVSRRQRTLVNASAIGFYGDRGDEELTEQSGPGRGFLADTCQSWERAAAAAEQANARLVLLRFGVVLAAHGGAMERILTPFKAFVGGPLGSGLQWFSWLHLRDAAGLVMHALDRAELSGPVNATAPAPETNETFSRLLAELMGRPCALRVPELALRVAMGEMAAIALDSTRVLPRAAERTGYLFEYPSLRPALEQVVSGTLS